MNNKAIKGLIQLRALNDPSGVTSGSQEDLTYTQLIADAILTWENERDVLWDELWLDMPNVTTISSSTATIDLEDDFKFIGGAFIRLALPGGGIIWRPVKMLRERVLNPQNTIHEFYVQGNPSEGYQLLLGWNVGESDAELGAQVSYCYYKTATQLVRDNDIPEMSDPRYIVYNVAATVAGLNYNWNLNAALEAKAADAMTNMRTGNEMASNYQDDYIKDADWLSGGRRSIPNRMNSGYWTGR